MAWTSPMTAVAAAIYTAAQFNTYTRDNLNALRATPANRCAAYNAGTQAVGASATTALTYDSERIDTAAMHSTSVNTSRITIPSGGGGDYLVSISVETGNGTIQLYVNGSAVTGTDVSGSSTTTVLSLTTLLTLAAADYVEVKGTDNTGGGLNFIKARLTVVGPLPPS